MKKTVMILILAILSFSAVAEEKAFQLSLTPDIAVHPESTVVKGISLSLWGENQQRSLALGFVNGTKGDSSGFSFGFIANYGENYTGVQMASVNYLSGNLRGAQLGFANYAETIESGFQFGFINYAETMTKGLQLGFINIIRNNKDWFGRFPDEVAPAMVFLNWRF